MPGIIKCSVKAGPQFLTALKGASPKSFIKNDVGLPVASPASPKSTSGIICFYRAPKSNKQFIISGITKDNTGAALGNCTVKLFTAVDDVMRYQTVSDASGNSVFRTATCGGFCVQTAAR